MIVRPVIEREMAQAARQSLNYYLRSLGALAVLGACIIGGSESNFAASSGGDLFAFLHLVVFWIIWLVVPFATADCISRERREGTIGLLFLTHLRSTDVVTAKGLAQGLRGATLWLAVVPVVMIPLLQGGVGWREAVLSVGINFGSLCLALAAGLLASAWSKAWVRSMVAASIWAGILLLTWSFFAAQILSSALLARRFGFYGNTMWSSLVGLGFLSNASGDWADYLRLSQASQLSWALAQVILVALMMLVVAVWLAGARTGRSWQDLPPSEIRLWFDRVFCTPVLLLRVFRGWMRRKLERNPIGWLEQRRWSGRLVTWTWLAVLISLYSGILTNPQFYRDSSGMQRPLAWLLIGSMAVSAAGSFRRERESGVLELLLVSPLREEQIIWGRVRGLWGQFMPAAALLLGLWTYFAVLFNDANAGFAIWSTGVVLLLLPLIGLYYSVRCRSFVAALGSTLMMGILLPWGLPTVIGFLEWVWVQTGGLPPTTHIFPRDLLLTAAWTTEGAVACLCWFGLVRRLRNRSFPMRSTQTA